MSFTPACMDAAELRLWRTANSAGERPALRPCFDCPAWFARQARAEGCCNGEPGPIARTARFRAEAGLKPMGRPRQDYTPVERIGSRGRGHAYSTEELRRAALRETWRESKRRRSLLRGVLEPAIIPTRSVRRSK